jgi:hypothetical protein
MAVLGAVVGISNEKESLSRRVAGGSWGRERAEREPEPGATAWGVRSERRRRHCGDRRSSEQQGAATD